MCGEVRDASRIHLWIPDGWATGCTRDGADPTPYLFDDNSLLRIERPLTAEEIEYAQEDGCPFFEVDVTKLSRGRFPSQTPSFV